MSGVPGPAGAGGRPGKFLPRGESFPAPGRDSFGMDSGPGDEMLLLAVVGQLGTQAPALRSAS